METLMIQRESPHDAAVPAAVEPSNDALETTIPVPSGSRQGAPKKRNRKTLPRRFRRDFLMSLAGNEGLGHSLSRDLAAIESDMGGGNNMSFAQQTLAQRSIWLTEILREHERRVARGESIVLGDYVRGVQTLTTLFRTLGIRRVAKPVEDLHTYMQRRASEIAGGKSEG